MTAAPPLRPGRAIVGMSAVLLTLAGDGSIDWTAFGAHVERTHRSGLTPAVNMDTGFVQLLRAAEIERVLDTAAEITGGQFVAGAYVDDRDGDSLDEAAYLKAAEAIVRRGGVPVVFPSYGLAVLPEPEWVAALASFGSRVDRFIAFELSTAFAPQGRLLSLDAYRGVLEIPQCIGAKHSSLDRGAEWDRLALRDEVRPDFLVLSGNDLAIDMVMYGSDYLLGLSTFAPELFAARDRLWAGRERDFHQLNDLLQYLGQFAFRPPVPAYRHDAAMFLHLRGWAASDRVPPGAPERPASDRAVLADILERLEQW